jgi:prefoldin subunit 5
MVTPDEKNEIAKLKAELRRLKHLQKTRMLSLDDGRFVRDVVEQMGAEIERLQSQLETLESRTRSEAP